MFKEQKERAFFLKREERKLKEQEFQRMKERQRQIEFNRKLEILQKEKKHEEYVKKNKTMLHKFTQRKIEKSIKGKIEEEKMVFLTCFG